MNARIEPWSTEETDSLREVQRCLDAALPRGIVRAALEDSAARVLRGRESVATARELLHRYRDDGRISPADCDRILSVLEARVSDNARTIPGISPDSDVEDDPFTKTAVLPSDVTVAAPSNDDRLQVGSVLRDRFMLQERVATGGMGVVYKALDRRLAEVDGVDPWVAIKVLAPELAGNAKALRALQQEAAKGRCLTHPNIVRFIDFDREDDLYFIVLEWLEGRSLAAVLDAADAQPDQEVSLNIVRQVGEALAYAHRCGVVHADVKPGNIMVLPSGAVKLYDFGIARVRQKQQGNGVRPDAAMLGAATPAYSSMQVLTGEEPVAADDVFSLACLAYRLLAGHRVFGPRNAAEAAERGMEPQRPQGISDAQWKALRKALSHARVARYGSTTEFLAALQASPAPPPQDAPLVVPDEAVAVRRYAERRRVWPYLVLLLLGAGVAVSLLRPDWVAQAVVQVEAWLPVEWRVSTPDAPGPASPQDADVSAAPAADAAAEPPSGGPPQAASPETESVAAGRDTVTATDSEPVAGTEAEPAATDAASRGTAMDRMADAAAETPPATVAGASDDPEVAAALAGAEGSVALVLAAPGQQRPELDLSLQEGGEPITVDVYRWFGLGEGLTVRIDEVGFSGNRSPRDAGQYTLSGNGVVSFDRNQRHTTLEIGMPGDAEREPDQQVSLLLRDYYNVESELALLNVSLLDDDQRAFEANHAVNTIAFPSSQVSVPERDPAVQIDVLRLNPDRRTLSVSYTVEDVTATDGEDYFSPGRRTITFGPGQRTARLLIPLVQDSLRESDEAFYIELDVPAGDANTFRRIAVIIRDDD